MNTQQKDQAFIDFYGKNKTHIQRFVKEKFPQQFIQDVRIENASKEQQRMTSNDGQENDLCRIS